MNIRNNGRFLSGIEKCLPDICEYTIYPTKRREQLTRSWVPLFNKIKRYNHFVAFSGRLMTSVGRPSLMYFGTRLHA